MRSSCVMSNCKSCVTPNPPYLCVQTAHVGALYPAFLAMQLTAGVPPIIAALSLGFMTCGGGRGELCKCGEGPAI